MNKVEIDRDALRRLVALARLATDRARTGLDLHSIHTGMIVLGDLTQRDAKRKATGIIPEGFEDQFEVPHGQQLVSIQRDRLADLVKLAEQAPAYKDGTAWACFAVNDGNEAANPDSRAAKQAKDKRDWAIRTEAEKRIIGQLLDDVFNRGYSITVAYDRYDGEAADEALDKTTDKSLILANLWACDEEYLVLHDPYNGNNRHGWVLLVHGNHPSEVIADYTGNLDKIVNTNAAKKITDEIEAQDFA